MKALVAFTLLLVPMLAAGPLEDFRWKKRVLVVTESSEPIGKELREAKAGLAERDVKVFVLSGEAIVGKAPDKELTAQLRERLKPKKEKPEVFLIGKDGNTVLRWDTAKFTAADLFAKIDSMPMRKDEMER
jgi:hypothetical protein